jgi:hypothetical protein
LIDGRQIGPPGKIEFALDQALCPFILGMLAGLTAGRRC